MVILNREKTSGRAIHSSILDGGYTEIVTTKQTKRVGAGGWTRLLGEVGYERLGVIKALVGQGTRFRMMTKVHCWGAEGRGEW